MSKLTYQDKVKLYDKPSVPEINKITDGNMNEIKRVVNANDDRLTTAEGEIDTAQLEIDNLQTGWNLAGETWTYASVDDPTGVITISGDKTTKYSLGMRIKFTNGGNTIYGIITAISYSSPNTTLTFLHEINPSTSKALHLMANSAITLNYYSNMKAPFGFPLNPSKWSLKTQFSNRINSIPAQSAKTLNSIIIPIGVWDIIVSGYSSWYSTAGQGFDGRIGLNTTQDTEPNTLGLALSFLDTINSIGVVRTNTSFSYLNYITTIQTTLYWNIFMYSPTDTYNGVTSCWCWVKCAYL